MTNPLIDLNALRGKLFTAESVAELLKITPASIRRRIREGHLPARKVPGQKNYAISGDDLAAYLLGDSPAALPGRTLPPAPPKRAAAPIDPNALPAVLPKTANALLKAWMTERELSQKELAEITGMNGGEVSRILSGKRAISRRNAERLRAAHGDDLVSFLTGVK